MPSNRKLCIECHCLIVADANLCSLSQPENIRTLLEYVVNEPSDGDDERIRFKYPNIAAEVLTSECWPIMDAMCKPVSS